jgi:2-polyprenyl-6-methoxyphenol hydroxylase-like FAD-dependent oxidoreductase
MTSENFKVIVVGGGPVGLTAAHALSRAGLDYIVLENRHSVTIDVGASLVLWPQGLRVLAQLGLLDRLREIGADLGHMKTVTLDAHKYKETGATETIKRK